MKIALLVARILLGSMFLFAGLNGFFHFVPQPAAPEAAEHFASTLFATGYMWPFIKGTEVVVALLLLSGRFVPLALVVLMPIMLNIVGFHLFLEPVQTAVLPLVLFGLLLFQAWGHRAVYAPLLRATQAPGRARADFSATSGALAHQ